MKEGAWSEQLDPPAYLGNANARRRRRQDAGCLTARWAFS